MVSGDVNIYYSHEVLTPGNVRAASYGTESSSGTLVPEVGDVFRDFHGWDGEYQAITVRVVRVKEIDTGGLHRAFEILVATKFDEAR
jgi:hypothetical protein